MAVVLWWRCAACTDRTEQARTEPVGCRIPISLRALVRRRRACCLRRFGPLLHPDHTALPANHGAGRI
ncbi:hypothetical protein [Acetobacter nitrogenifigens]|uniref:hypothetical protein n=1 Tax=Acetobacter nitrogenifigens TaxID=285268 RepID=UPI00040167BF|nr:hypothetical protein [Acetobacter nitrogenifigens]